jgi:aminoglycoside 6'-N-acetyltransferase
MMPRCSYQFRSVLVADLPLIQHWLEPPQVRQWWGDPVRGLSNINKHLTDPAIDVFIVSCDDGPCGSQQSYDPHAEVDHPFGDQPIGSRGIDQFIGEPDFSDRGHGSAFLRACLKRMFEAGAPRVVTDSHPRHAPAIRADAKAGLHPIGARATLSGDALLMSCDARTVNP